MRQFLRLNLLVEWSINQTGHVKVAGRPGESQATVAMCLGVVFARKKQKMETLLSQNVSTCVYSLLQL
jgi:hypothetical protein